MLDDCLRQRYPGDGARQITVREFVRGACTQHVDNGLGDANFLSELCAGDDARYWQRLSEALLSNELYLAGLVPERCHSDRPDFLLLDGDTRIWIEVICPEPSGISADWLEQPSGKAVSFPHEAMLLRWTAAIKEKTEKLVGVPEKGLRGYLEKGVVSPDDIYVIAINGRRLRGSAFASLTGISQFPFPVEAVFAVGPISVPIDPATRTFGEARHEHRPVIPKVNGAAVPAYAFLSGGTRQVSAIWGCDIDETWVIGNRKQAVVVHNPNADRRLPGGFLPAEFEYVARAQGEDEYLLERIGGRNGKDGQPTSG